MQYTYLVLYSDFLYQLVLLLGLKLMVYTWAFSRSCFVHQEMSGDLPYRVPHEWVKDRLYLRKTTYLMSYFPFLILFLSLPYRFSLRNTPLINHMYINPCLRLIFLETQSNHSHSFSPYKLPLLSRVQLRCISSKVFQYILSILIFLAKLMLFSLYFNGIYDIYINL